jgi:hypothetical protein
MKTTVKVTAYLKSPFSSYPSFLMEMTIFPFLLYKIILSPKCYIFFQKKLQKNDFCRMCQIFRFVFSNISKRFKSEVLNNRACLKIGNAVFSPPNGHLLRQKASSNDSLTAFFPLKLTGFVAKSVIPSIFKQALIQNCVYFIIGWNFRYLIRKFRTRSLKSFASSYAACPKKIAVITYYQIF